MSEIWKYYNIISIFNQLLNNNNELLHEKTYDLVSIFDMYFFAQILF